MRSITRHIIINLIVACYLTIILAGHLEIFRKMLNTGDTVQIVDTSKTSIPIEEKAYFVQGKHLPLTIKVQVPSDSFISTFRFPNRQSIIYPNYSSSLSPIQIPKFIRYLPRDPPSSSGTFSLT